MRPRASPSLLLRCRLSPGDIVMLTAAVRDLHRAHPGAFRTDVRTTARELWAHNPHLTPLQQDDPAVRQLQMHYPLIHRSNEAACHFIHGFHQDLEAKLGVTIPVSEFRGDVHLAEEEKAWMSQVQETGRQGPFWILIAGGKADATTKWPDPAVLQRVVDHLRDRILFVQCGSAEHWHPPLEGVVNLVGRTDLRQFVRLMYHAQGVVCPVTFAMHLAAAGFTADRVQPQGRTGGVDMTGGGAL